MRVGGRFVYCIVFCPPLQELGNYGCHLRRVTQYGVGETIKWKAHGLCWILCALGQDSTERDGTVCVSGCQQINNIQHAYIHTIIQKSTTYSQALVQLRSVSYS